MDPTLAHPKTRAEWRNLILEHLGGVDWNVELTERHLDQAIWETLALYNKYMPHWKWRPLGEVSGDAVFDFNDEPVGVQVKDVQFHRQELHHTHQSYPQYSYHYGFLNMRSARMAHKSLVAEDRYRSFLGMQPDYKWDAENRRLHLKSIASLWPVLASALLLVPNTVDKIPFHWEYDFLTAATGHAKQILARLLGKFGAIPGAQGNITLDAETQRSEGKEMVAEIKRNLDRNIKRMPPKPIFS